MQWRAKASYFRDMGMVPPMRYHYALWRDHHAAERTKHPRYGQGGRLDVKAILSAMSREFAEAFAALRFYQILVDGVEHHYEANSAY